MDSPQPEANQPGTANRRIRTIVADDSPEFLRSFCSFLEAQDNLEIVGRARNGAEAVRLADNLHPDLAILDLEMPEMDGTRAAEILREKFPSLRIIIVSVHDGPAWREMSHTAGVNAFVPKHQVTAELPNQIRTLFGAKDLPEAPPYVGSNLGTPHNLIDVLLVDDQNTNAAAVSHALTRPRVAGQTTAHFEVEHVTSVAAAAELLQQHPVDAVLIGIRAAEASTLQRITALRQAAAPAPLIAVPDTADEHLAIAAGALGADECVSLAHAELLPLALRFLVGGHRAEKSLAKREEDLRMLIENALDITCIMDGDLKVRYISPSTRRVLGFNPEELRGRPCLAFIHSDDAADAQRVFDEARAHPQQTVSLEVRFQHRMGTWVHLEMTGRNLPDNAGQVRLVFNARDITTRKQAEEFLRQSEQRFRVLFESSPDAMFVENFEGRVLDVNTAGCWLHGLAREEIIGQFVWQLIPPEAQAQARRDFPRLVSGELAHLESASLAVDGRTIPIELTASRILYSGQPAVLLNARDITERKRAEAALEASMTTVKTLQQALDAHALVTITDEQGKITYANDKFCATSQYTRAELIGQNHRIINSGYHSKEFFRDMWNTITQGQIWKSEVRNRAKDGTLYWMDTTVVPFLNPEGKPYQYVAIHADISDRKRAEELLAASERSYRGLFNTMRDAIYILDPAGHFIDVNEGAVKMYGHEREFFAGKTPEFLSAPDRNDMAATATALQQALAGVPQYFEWWGLRKNGEVFPKEVTLQPGTYFGQQVIIAVGRDITERKRVENALRESESRLRQIAENIEEVFWLESIDQQIIYVSPAYEKIWGDTIQNLKANPERWFAAIHEEDRERVTAAHHVARQNGHFDQTYRIIRPDGSRRWIREQAFPVHDEQGKFYRIAGVARDITERHEIEEQMRQMQKLDSLGRITASIAHDFNNMLAVIQGHSDQLLLDPGLNTATAKSINQIADASRRATKLTRQLLTFSRKQDMHFQTLDLNEVVTGLTPMLQRVVNKQTRFHTQFPANPSWIRADGGMIEQVLLNLVVNARDAMPDGGELTITTETVEVDTAFLRRDSQANRGQHIRLTVADTGCGITPDILPRIFEPFFTTKPHHSGTGLGLATVYGIVKQHNGWIEVETEPGHGAKFKIYFPASAASVQPAAPAATPNPTPAAAAAAPAAAATILVVEDELPLLQLHRLNWTKRGYKVLTAETGPRALETVASHTGTIEMLITDMGLPGGMNGRALAEQLLAQNPKLQVIITSGYNESTDSPSPNIQFLPKPFDFKQLGNLIAQTLAKQ